MIATSTAELFDRLRRGILDRNDTSMLEHARASELVAELRSVYRITFQERHLGKKWEVSLARFLLKLNPQGLQQSTPFGPVRNGSRVPEQKLQTRTAFTWLSAIALWFFCSP